jgi:hypothetical protein
MRLTDYVSLNFNNNMSRTAVFLDVEKVYSKGYTSRGATRFGPVPHIVKSVYNWYALNI